MQDRARTVCDRLASEYADTDPLLTYNSPFELLIAVILSAQTTDVQVNTVTPELFAAYPNAQALATAPVENVERLIRSTGFFRTKARNIIACADAIATDHGGTIPSTMDQLTALPGVGRKTAGVILAVLYDKPAIIVDTHFSRVSRRLGFTEAKEPRRIERDIAEGVEETLWSELSMFLNRHGRRYCTARAPRCSECPLEDICPSAATFLSTA